MLDELEWRPDLRNLKLQRSTMWLWPLAAVLAAGAPTAEASSSGGDTSGSAHIASVSDNMQQVVGDGMLAVAWPELVQTGLHSHNSITEQTWWVEALSQPSVPHHQMGLAYETIRHHLCTMPLPPTKNAKVGSQQQQDYARLEDDISAYRKSREANLDTDGRESNELERWFELLDAGVFARFTPEQYSSEMNPLDRRFLRGLKLDLHDPVNQQLWQVPIDFRRFLILRSV
jgi:hypothetical protein